MDTRSIQKLRLKFIKISTITYFLVMFFLGTCINVSNYFITERQIHEVLDYMLSLNGNLPGSGQAFRTGSTHPRAESEASGTESDSIDRKEVESITGGTDNPTLDNFSPEFHYSARYFSATFDQDGTMTDMQTTHVRGLTDEQAALAAKAAYLMKSSYGRLGNYYFRRGVIDSGETMIIMLNCASQIRSNRRILMITCFIGLVGLAITLALVIIFSSRIIRPEIENARRQKQFITNASHELKTPLAVIRANTEIGEMMNGENEWTQSTMRQVERLDGLVQNLVMIARAAEREDRSELSEIDISKSVEESVNPYRSLAQQGKKDLQLAITPDVRMQADESKIRQLTALLVDNAFKYCDDEGTIRVSLDTLKKGKTVRLMVQNTYKEGANVDYSRFFERFYREDEAHNVDRGGYGIGLSIAESICHQYGGSINASWKNDEIIFTCLLN